MPQLPQHPRKIDIQLAEALGLSLDDMVAAQQALNFHDGSYNSFMAILRQYGASEDLLNRLQGTIEDEMGMTRQDIHPNDRDEHVVWGFRLQRHGRGGPPSRPD